MVPVTVVQGLQEARLFLSTPTRDMPPHKHTAMLTWGAQPFSKHVVGPILGHRIVLIQLIQEEVALTQLDPGR
jgi:hypothetical protein